MLNTLRQFNWVDIFAVVILLRVCYIAIKGGFLNELFKTLGTVSAIYLSLHYYTGLSDFIREHLPFKNIPLDFLDFIFFIVLAITGYLLFVILRLAILKFINMEPIPKLDKWGGLVLGITRAFLLTSLIIFTLLISTIAYFKKSVVNSYSGEYLSKIAPSVYTGLWDGVASKFMTKEKFNQTVTEVQFSNPAKK
jgi:uncharacterized membrane protein required for colicin V production